VESFSSERNGGDTYPVRYRWTLDEKRGTTVRGPPGTKLLLVAKRRGERGETPKTVKKDTIVKIRLTLVGSVTYRIQA